jgi:hypothetical protein
MDLSFTEMIKSASAFIGEQTSQSNGHRRRPDQRRQSKQRRMKELLADLRRAAKIWATLRFCVVHAPDAGLEKLTKDIERIVVELEKQVLAIGKQ